MGQAVKYAVLGAALVAVIVAAVALIAQSMPGSWSDSSSAFASFLATATTTIRNVRGALNYVLGTSLVGFAVPFYLTLPMLLIGLKVSVTVYRWINQ